LTIGMASPSAWRPPLQRAGLAYSDHAMVAKSREARNGI
jgi:hypothetical protein